MKESVKSAKAVVGISEVHFLKWANGAEPTVDANLFVSSNTDADWFSVATIKGSVTCAQDALSTTKVNIDQSNMPIGISTEPGDFNIEAQLPSMISSDLAKWLDKDATKITIEDGAGNQRDGYGYDFNAELIDTVLAIKSQTGDWFVFPNVKGDVAFGMEDNVWVLKFAGQVLGATKDGNKSVYVFADAHSSAQAEA